MQFLSIMEITNNHRLRGEKKLKYLLILVEFESYISCTVILSWFLDTLSYKNSSFCRAVILLP